MVQGRRAVSYLILGPFSDTVLNNGRQVKFLTRASAPAQTALDNDPIQDEERDKPSRKTVPTTTKKQPKKKRSNNDDVINVDLDEPGDKPAPPFDRSKNIVENSGVRFARALAQSSANAKSKPQRKYNEDDREDFPGDESYHVYLALKAWREAESARTYKSLEDILNTVAMKQCACNLPDTIQDLGSIERLIAWKKVSRVSRCCHSSVLNWAPRY